MKLYMMIMAVILTISVASIQIIAGLTPCKQNSDCKFACQTCHDRACIGPQTNDCKDPTCPPNLKLRHSDLYEHFICAVEVPIKCPSGMEPSSDLSRCLVSALAGDPKPILPQCPKNYTQSMGRMSHIWGQPQKCVKEVDKFK